MISPSLPATGGPPRPSLRIAMRPSGDGSSMTPIYLNRIGGGGGATCSGGGVPAGRGGGGGGGFGRKRNGFLRAADNASSSACSRSRCTSVTGSAALLPAVRRAGADRGAGVAVVVRDTGLDGALVVPVGKGMPPPNCT